MGIMVYSLLWEMQDLYHQPYVFKGSSTGWTLALILQLQTSGSTAEVQAIAVLDRTKDTRAEP